MIVYDRLTRLQLILLTGKGGVGKSTLSAVLGRLLADSGRRVLLLEVDPRESLHQLLEVQPSDGAIVRVSPKLWLQHLAPRAILDDLVREKLKVGLLVKKVLESPTHQHFTEAAPGLKEAAVFGRALRLLDGHGPRGAPRPDVIVLDAPATGHGLSWLSAAQLVSDVISSGPIGRMAREVATFVEDPQRCGFVVVTTGEEMPVQETIELLATMDSRLGRTAELIIANALYPPCRQPQRDTGEDVLADLWADRRAINDAEVDRLRESWDGPMIELPLLPLDPGPALVGRLGSYLRRSLDGRR